MAELSQIKQRARQERDKPLERRSAILPERRNQAPNRLEMVGDMRSASRGDVGGAEALLRLAREVNNTGRDIQGYINNKWDSEQDELLAEGKLDVATGKVDEEKFAKEASYRNAVTKGRTVTFFQQGLRDFDKELRELVENQTDADPAVRAAEVREFTEQFFQKMAFDPETGELRDNLQTPGAMRYLGQAIEQARPQILANAEARVEERFKGEALTHYSNTIVTMAEGGMDINLAELDTLLPATVTQDERRMAFFSGMEAAAAALKADGQGLRALQIYDSVIGDTPAPVSADVPEAVATGGVATVAAGITSKPTGRLPFGTTANITNNYAQHRQRGSHGIDIDGKIGDPIEAPAGGKVIEVDAEGKGASGKFVRIQHADGSVSSYSHLSSIDVGVGAEVTAGTVFAKMGNTGRVSKKTGDGSHLHYRVKDKDGKDVDPLTHQFGDYVTTGSAETAPASNPQFRLQKPKADPFTAYEQSGEVPLPPEGIEKLGLKPEEIVKLRQQREALRRDLAKEWTEAQEEERSLNATRFALGFFGQGQRPTAQDIANAVRDGSIDPQSGLTLFRMLREEGDRAVAADERNQREEDRQAEERAANVTAKLLSDVIAKRITPAQARQRGLEAAGQEPNGKAKAAIINGALAAAGDMENLLQNTPGVRQTLRRVDDGRDAIVASIPSTVRGKARENAVSQIDQLLDRVRTDIALDVRDGVPVEQAEKNAMEKYGPRLRAAANPAKR